ncbi:hypothetical protein R6L23_29395 [Streptomyces sp. SR27]|uniref:hypothetical protein n=1 Tax=Streptomyces sp. SR27 TaxID=3076630 RepID=UPI00295BD145|nr:hypothetical protein [Streptomyces sp. SR27]MDV9192274.1 hypothetical protein [Streptomyces sp. SR27]
MEAYVDGGGFGMLGMSTAAVRYNSETMTEFKASIDKMIENLTSSEADTGKVKSDPVVRGQFGGGGAAWGEAHGVYDAYSSVIQQLTELSGLLRDCLEGLGIAVVASKDGFAQMDDDIKQKMINIHQRTEDAKVKADNEAGRGTPQNQGNHGTTEDDPYK